ncbi:MAG: ATP-binding protein [Lysobacterales bacterium]
MGLMFVVQACLLQAAAAGPLISDPVFRVIGTEEGLPSQQIQALAEDAEGRIWIGTANGLVRFDGHAIRNYPARLERANALASISVEAMTIDGRQQLWVTTQGGQLARWRPESDDFLRFDLVAMLQAEQLEAWALAADDQRLWVGTYGSGLLELDLDGRVVAQHPIPAALGGGHILDLSLDRSGTLWLGTLDKRLLRFDPDRVGFSAPDADFAPDSLPVFAIAQRQGRPWFSTSDGRLCTIEGSQPPHCQELSQLALPGRARLLLADARGDWIGGRGEMLRVLDGIEQRLSYTPGSRGGIPAEGMRTALIDHSGGLWFGTSGGGLLHLPNSADRFAVWQPDPLARSGLLNGRVRGIARDADGLVWIGTLGAGLHRLTPATGRIQAVPLPGTGQWRVWAVLACGRELWVGHQGGLLRLQPQADGGLRHLQQWSADDLVDGNVDLLYQHHDGRIWATSMGAGLNAIDPRTGEVERHVFGENGLVGTEVQQLREGLDGQLWVATDRALLRLDSGCRCWQTLLPSVRVDAFSADGSGGMYAFVDGNLVHYLWRSGLYRDARRAPRAFAEFQTLGGMWLQQGALWMAGPQGLFRYFPEQDRLESFDGRDGLPTREFSDRPFLAEPDGRLWIGGEAGLISVDTAMVSAPAMPARLRFEQIRVDGPDGMRELKPHGRAELQPEERELLLSVRLNTLARTHAQRFSFRLVGWDEDWTEATSLPERRFGALSDGDYTLQIRAWDGDGRAAANTLEWAFTVLPPWWRSAWALAAYALLLVLSVAAIERWRQLRRRSAERWRETRRQAEWAAQLATERTALVAELSHEIRNPLNGVLGMGRLLGEQPLPQTGQRYLQLLNDAGRQLLHLLDDMLDWSRLEAGAAPLPLKVVKLTELLDATLARYSQQAAERGLWFRVAIDPTWRVRVDPPRLLQIIENLLSNAIKFTLRGGVDIGAAVAGNQLWIRVRDSGPGMSAEQAARLFRPFERVGDQRAAPGTGLGLAISRSLAERMGGSLTVESTPGLGSVFILSLMLATEAGSAIDMPSATMDGSATSPLSGQAVLVVDDDPVARELLLRELGALGARVHLAADALSALIVAQQQALSLALIDWDLPGMSGVELAQTLQLQQPQLLLIAVTGRGTPEDLARSVEVGFRAHLLKPVRPELLVATLLEALELR